MSNGTWIQTYHNQKLDFLNPDPESIMIDDIAIGLARTCRFAGQTEWFYSVAQHSVQASRVAQDPVVALYALLHDAHEAYTGDIPQPLKRQLPGIIEIEGRIQLAIYRSMGIAPPTPGITAKVKEIDMRLLVTENRLLFRKNLWDFDIEGYSSTETDIRFWDVYKAQANFLLELFSLR